MRPNLLLLFTLIIVISSCTNSNLSTIDLSGEWQFQMDPNDKGEQEEWFNKDFAETIQLPGSMVENGKGYPISLETKWTGKIQLPEWYKDPRFQPYFNPENIRFPFWLQPDKKYTGAAWYQKKVDIPKDWAGKIIRLQLERPHWETTIWVNGAKVEMQNSLATGHIFDLSDYLKMGENKITVCVDNRIKDIDMGENAHSVTDHTQSNWNGIVGKIELVATDNVYIENIQVFPNISNKTAQINATIINSNSEIQNVKLAAFAQLKGTGTKLANEEKEVSLSPGENTVKLDYALGEDALLWDEFSPNIYQLTLALNADSIKDSHSVDFGLREFKVENSTIINNGRRVFMRGTLDCAVFPLTGYPPMDKTGWKKVFEACQAHGLNHIRFHSWCPPKAAFEVADEMGFYIQAECSSWANIGNGEPIDQYIWEESKRIVAEYGNHPSFVMMTYGNEPAGKNSNEFLTEFVSYWKKADKRRIYTSGAGWPMLPVNDYHNIHNPRIQSGMPPIKNVLNAEAPKTSYDWSPRMPKDGIPVISHEIGQFCVYPNFKEIEKYTGVLKPKNIEIFQESLIAHNMGHLADSFFMASGKLQALCYKAEIESAMRTPNFGGFQLLDLSDFPGQGTALVGVLDPFYEEKGYISPEEFKRFCNTTVPLARLEKRIFTEGETLKAKIEVAHFGEKSFEGVNPKWKILKEKEIITEGTFGQQDITIGNCIQIGEVNYQFQKENKPRKLKLEIEVEGYTNSWDFWVYPEKQNTNFNEVRVVDLIDKSTSDYLENGGKVMLSLGKGKVNPNMGGKIGLGFSSIFWNTAWFPDQKLRTLGILCNPNHPALEQFPTEYYSNWQWWDATYHGSVIQLDSLSNEIEPIVRIIDDWFTNRSVALIFEVKVGEGKLLISGVDLVNGLENRPEARQLKYSLLSYMSSNKFNPTVLVELERIEDILDLRLNKNISEVSASASAPGYDAINAIDGDVSTFWHSPFQEKGKGLPQYITLDLGNEKVIKGLTYVARQVGNDNSRIKNYEILISKDGVNFSKESKGTVLNTNELQKLSFKSPQKTRFVRIKVLNAYGDTSAAVAELNIEE